MNNFYSVHKGIEPGIYNSWDICLKHVKGFKGAIYKKFSNYDDAYLFYKNGCCEHIEKKKIQNKKIKKDDYSEISSIDLCDDNIYIYTDGSCINNGKKNAKAGIGIYFGKSDKRNISEKFLSNPTNQRAEIYAIIKCIEIILKDTKINDYSKVKVYTDSQYAINCITKWIPNWIKNNWNTTNNLPVKNRDLLEILYKYYNLCKVDFVHINSHTNKKDRHSIGNDQADKLALKASLL